MRRTAGFTLLELLVVVAIIATLAAILFPVFAQARSKARAVVCLSSVKQWGMATLLYTQDYDERFPRFYRQVPNWNRANLGGVPTLGAGGYYWHEAIFSYIPNHSTLLCPEAQGAVNQFCLPYGWNWAFVHDNALAEYPFPAETLVIADGRGRLSTDKDRTVCAGAPPEFPRPCADCIDEGKYIYAHGLIPPAAAASDPNNIDLTANWSVSPRHHGKANIVFMDGHAKAVDATAVNRCNNYWDGDGLAGDCRVGTNHPRYSIAYQ
jgi:prepilin-type N-terminal cleavage/methylation domain-containing protein/prepilin-type processing-associated H-X9-DG protein